MKKLRNALFIVGFTFGALACNPSKDGSPSPERDTQLSGKWELTQIRYGLTGKVATPQEAGYTETLNYNNDGTFNRLRNGKEEEKGSFTTANIENIAGFTTAIYYQNTTYQPYRIQENILRLYERAPIGGVLADGATYEYRKL
ncbi:hypothetical protein [Larkinella rosea]|uniref:Lipocalin-like domain-containing protein n=1 Tax=Larkinella rosea TaxID=2025312 RepID=A0A3P1BCQ9_9BACT|nr:hypothetical protein [Larkinella rosea]RRA98552.1 hypothetical protein EHT25_26465 [Larkinella rosea]